MPSLLDIINDSKSKSKRKQLVNKTKLSKSAEKQVKFKDVSDFEKNKTSVEIFLREQKLEKLEMVSIDYSVMTKETLILCLEMVKNSNAHTLDLTGGAPEMNPNFKWFVEEASKIGIKDFIVRSNLTIITSNKKYHYLPEFFKKHNIHVVSSMPHWTKGKTDKQRGNGVFSKSIQALKMLASDDNFDSGCLVYRVDNRLSLVCCNVRGGDSKSMESISARCQGDLRPSGANAVVGCGVSLYEFAFR